MESLFLTLNSAMSGAPFVALLAALAWGVASVVLSPCHLASIPLIVAFVDSQGRTSTARACYVSTLFSVGILVSIALIGLITAAAGRMVGDIGQAGIWIVAGIFILVGLHLLDLVPLTWPAPARIRLMGKGALSALLLGLFFGIALGPCTFAYMAPVLAVSFSSASQSLLFSAALLLVYGIGHCVVIVLAGTCTGAIQRYLDWNERSRGALALKRICGALIIAGGIWLIYSTS
ncbi:MAG: cytochrome c biogenesis protein CcdA [Pelovirga sp.]